MDYYELSYLNEGEKRKKKIKIYRIKKIMVLKYEATNRNKNNIS